MKTIFIYIVCLFLSYQGVAQHYWNNKYHFGTPAANAMGIVYNPIADKLIVSGSRDDVNGHGNYSYMQIISMSGNQEELKVISENDSIEYGFDVSNLSYSDNFYYAVGAYYDGTQYLPRGMLIKIDSNLDTVFCKSYSGLQNNKGIIMRQSYAEDDSIFIAGSIETTINNNTLTQLNGILIIADSNGNELKRVEFGTTAYFEEILDIQKAGNKLVCAVTKEKPLGMIPPNFYTYDWRGVVLVYDHSGNVLQSYTTPEKNIWATSVTPTIGGGYAFCGVQLDTLRWDSLGSKTYLKKGYIEKINGNMQREWKLALSKHDTTASTEFYKIIANDDGSVVAAGKDQDNEYSNKHISGWMVKVSAQGQVIWQRYHKVVYTDEEEHFFNDMCKAPDGGYALAGVAFDFTPYTPQNPVGTYAWVCKTDSFGCLVPGCELVGIAENTPLESSIKLYPNPTSDRLFLYYNNPQLQNCVFTIRDMTGREIVPQTALQNSTTYEIVVRDWAAGLYFVRVQDENGNFYTEKIVKE